MLVPFCGLLVLVLGLGELLLAEAGGLCVGHVGGVAAVVVVVRVLLQGNWEGCTAFKMDECWQGDE